MSPPDGWAVVAGATGALGGAIARRLQARGLGVVGVARNGEALAALAGDGFLPCPADVGSDETIERVRAATPGPVRMVVQATGLAASGGIDVVDPDLLGASVALKVGGLLRLVRAVDDRLGPRSRIVALGGHFGAEPGPHASAAGVTNAALANAVRQLADVYGPRGVTVHLLAPGPVGDTERMRRISLAAAERRGVGVDVILAERSKESPLGRFVTADEVAWAAALLLAPEADALHGATLALDAGARRGIF